MKRDQIISLAFLAACAFCMGLSVGFEVYAHDRLNVISFVLNAVVVLVNFISFCRLQRGEP